MTNEEYIKSLPQEIKDKMMDYQERDGNPRDITIFYGDIYTDKGEKGFNWNTNNGIMWKEILSKRNYLVFYDVYPKEYYAIQLDNEILYIKTNVAFINLDRSIFSFDNKTETIDWKESGKIKDIRDLTKTEKVWLDVCIKAGKYIEPYFKFTNNSGQQVRIVYKNNCINVSEKFYVNATILPFKDDKVYIATEAERNLLNNCIEAGKYVEEKLYFKAIGVVNSYLVKNNISINVKTKLFSNIYYNFKADIYTISDLSHKEIAHLEQCIAVKSYVDFNDEMKDYPQEIIDYAIKTCEELGDEPYRLHLYGINATFSWEDSTDGYDFWDRIERGNFATFYKKYPTKYKEGDLVVCTTNIKDHWFDNNEVIKLGGKYWEDASNVNNMISVEAMSKQCLDGNGMGNLHKNSFTIRKATEKEILNSIWYEPNYIAFKCETQEELDAVKAKIESLVISKKYLCLKSFIWESVLRDTMYIEILRNDIYQISFSNLESSTKIISVKDFLGDFPIKTSYIPETDTFGKHVDKLDSIYDGLPKIQLESNINKRIVITANKPSAKRKVKHTFKYRTR